MKRNRFISKEALGLPGIEEIPDTFDDWTQPWFEAARRTQEEARSRRSAILTPVQGNHDSRLRGPGYNAPR